MQKKGKAYSQKKNQKMLTFLNKHMQPFQITAVNNALQSLSNKQSDIVVAPGGAGKSHIIKGILKELSTKDKIVILQPTLEILQQNYDRYIEEVGNDDIGIYSASARQKNIGRVTYATIQSISTKTQMFQDVKYVIIDEAHVVNSDKEQRIYMQFINNIKPHIIGLTATPYRLNQKNELKMLHRQESSVFKDICFNVSMKSLIEDGRLSKFDYVIAKQINLNSCLLNGDFNEDLVNRYYLNEESILNNIMDIVCDYAKNRKHCLIFASSVKMQEKIVDLLKQREQPVDYVNSSMEIQDRKNKLLNFKNGNVKFMVVVNIATVGFDFPALDTIVMLKPTNSLSFYVQSVTRGSRFSKGKTNCLVLDFANNLERFGKVEDIEIKRNVALKNEPYDVFYHGKTSVPFLSEKV